nr:MAG: cytochrome c family protein [Hyphomicrobiales bacterium]
MDMMHWNKIAGGVLIAALCVVAARLGAEALYRAEPPEYPAYIIEGADELPAPPVLETLPEDASPDFARAIPAANLEHGETLAAPCAICHNWTEGGASAISPNLFDVVGREKAGIAGFNYSQALQSLDGVWTYADLYAFLEQPSAFAPGTIMGFAGLPGEQDRLDLIALMRSWSATPAPLPDAEQAP